LVDACGLVYFIICQVTAHPLRERYCAWRYGVY
jgi:hypothetical protein